MNTDLSLAPPETGMMRPRAPARARAATSSARVMLVSSALRTNDRETMTTRLTAQTPRAAATTSMDRAVVRARTEASSQRRSGRSRRRGRIRARRPSRGRLRERLVKPLTAIGSEAVSHAPHRLDGPPVVGDVDLAAEVPHVDLDDAGVAVVGGIPDVLEDLGLRRDLAHLPHQELEEGELPGGEVELVVAPPGQMGGGIEPQVAGRQHRRAGRCPPPQQRPQPGGEDHEREWFGQEVVGAGVERLGLVELTVLGGEHEDGRPVAGLPEGRAHPEAVHPGQHDVEDDGVVAAFAGPPEAVFPVRGDIDGEALRLQSAPYRIGEARFVLYQKDSHPQLPLPSVPRRLPTRISHLRQKAQPSGGPTIRAVSNPLTRDDVIHVASLARLALSEAEIEQFTVQLGA